MKSAWRELLSKSAIVCAGVGSLVMSSGCQTWSPTTWGVPTSARVQPPPTGTVKPQGAYYNNPPMGTTASPVKATTQVSPNFSTPVVQASAVNPMGSNGSMPATNLSDISGAYTSGATSISSQAFGDSKVGNGQVSTAGYNDNGAGMAQVVSAGSLQGPTSQGTGRYTSDSSMNTSSNAGEGANLQWTSK